MVEYLLHLNPRLRQVYTLLVNALRFALQNHDFKQFKTVLEESRKYVLPKKIHTTVQTLFKYQEGIRNYNYLRARRLISYRLTASRFEPKELY